jgi:parvulin-like peptidyl-prolyl isomerase
MVKRGIMVGIIVCLSGYLYAQGTDQGGIVARINDEVITEEEFKGYLSQLGDLSGQDRKLLLAQVVQQRLFAQEAKRLKITVTEQEIQAVLEAEKASFGEQKFAQYLKSIAVDEQRYRLKIKEEILLDKLIAKKYRDSLSGKDTSRVTLEEVSPEEIRRYYDQHKDQFSQREEAIVRVIVLSYSNDKEKEKRRILADSIMRHLKQGASFALLARYHSDMAARNYGLIKGLKREDPRLPLRLNRFIFTQMKEGQIKIVESSSAFYIVLLEKKIHQSAKGFEEVQQQIKAFLKRQRRQTNLLILREELLEKAYIWPPDLFDTIKGE